MYPNSVIVSKADGGNVPDMSIMAEDSICTSGSLDEQAIGWHSACRRFVDGERAA